VHGHNDRHTLIGCREIVPHIDDIAAAVPDALAELVKAASDR
jgi:hypothetical protein